MVRVPADSMDDVNRYKLCRHFTGGLGSLDWMRKHKPEIAAVIDAEIARLTQATADRKAARAAKKAATA